MKVTIRAGPRDLRKNPDIAVGQRFSLQRASSVPALIGSRILEEYPHWIVLLPQSFREGSILSLGDEEAKILAALMSSNLKSRFWVDVDQVHQGYAIGTLSEDKMKISQDKASAAADTAGQVVGQGVGALLKGSFWVLGSMLKAAQAGAIYGAAAARGAASGVKEEHEKKK